MVLEYKFDNSVVNLKVSIVGTLFLSVVFLLGGFDNIYLPHFQITVVIGMLLMLIYFFYDWRQVEWNVGIFILYVVILILEIIFFGMPNSPIEFGGSLSTGVLLEFALMSLPSIYVCMRILMAIPLIFVSISASQLKSL